MFLRFSRTSREESMRTEVEKRRGEDKGEGTGGGGEGGRSRVRWGDALQLRRSTPWTESCCNGAGPREAKEKEREREKGQKGGREARRGDNESANGH